MIELGQEVFRAGHEPFDRAELNPDHLVAGLLATAAELRQQGVDVQHLLAPLTTPADIMTSVVSGKRQRTQLTSIQNRLADKFSTEDHQLFPEDFGVVSTDRNGVAEAFVVLATPTGLFRGSYDAIMSRKQGNTAAYTIKVGGQRVDTRETMNRRVHRAMNVQALAGYIAAAPEGLPDRAPVGAPRTATWYTGDRPNALLAPFGYDDTVYPDRQWRDRSASMPSLTVRPGIKLPQSMLSSTA